MSNGPTKSVEQAGRQRRDVPAWLVLPGMLALVLLGLLAGRWMQPPAEVGEGEVPLSATDLADRRPTPRPDGETFSLTIDFGNGAERRFAALAWREDMTVLAAMQVAADFRPGLTFTYTGAGETAFLTSIDRLKNAGAGGGNWIYEINGQKPTRSMGLTTLQPGDALLWRYSGAP